MIKSTLKNNLLNAFQRFLFLKSLLLCFALFSCNFLFSQVNGYASVTSITGGGLTLNLSNATTTATASTQFTAGTQIIIMQMQDSTIGTRTNVTGFGSLGSIQSAGLYEIATINTVTPSATAPTSLTITSALTNTYNFNNNSTVQIITYPVLGGGGNFTTASNVTATAWNGIVGGVVAFQVGGQLTLANNITADASGFRGGSVSVDYYPGGTTCDTIGTTFAVPSNTRGEKGESVFRRRASFQRYGKEKIVNGGGGGVNINSGGGGGGNYTSGGKGGPGWNSLTGCPTGPEGLGGLSLSGSISGSRIFMGGGGGGGQANNSAGTSGANGGGIILITAASLVTTGGCGGGLRISANGGTSGNPGNDGAGGAGAGGSIVLNIGTYTVVAGCTVTISANGGNGGGVTDPASHAGGGGGGAGTVIFTGSQPVTNITTTASAGTGGKNNSAGTSFAGNGGAGSGILAGTSNPLPIELVLFTGHSEGAINKLLWETLSEINNDYFTVEKSQDGIVFVGFATVRGAGNSNYKIDYSTYDYDPYAGITYYRLKQTDYNGASTYSDIIQLDNQLNTISVDNVYPNPVTESVNFDFNTPIKGNVHIQLFAFTGQLVVDKLQSVSEGKSIINTNIQSLAKGIYSLRITFDVNGFTHTTKMMKD